MAFVSFPSIENFHTARKRLKGLRNLTPQTYKAKVKLHGTNGGIIINPNGQVMAQSRTHLIGTGNDNVGFAQWVEDNKSHWAKLKCDEQVTVYGEWCGPNIQKGTALNLLKEHIYVVFAVQVGIHADEYDRDTLLYVEPDTIRKMIGSLPKLYVMDWFDNLEITIDFKDKPSLIQLAEDVNQLVSQIDKCDPWVKRVFGVEGIGEGLVFYPSNQTRWDFTNYSFKVKGENHKIVLTQPMSVDVPRASSPDDFVNMVLTTARLEQALQEGAHGLFNKKYLGSYLAWLMADLKKETSNELRDSGLTLKDIKPIIHLKAREWFERGCE